MSIMEKIFGSNRQSNSPPANPNAIQNVNDPGITAQQRIAVQEQQQQSSVGNNPGNNVVGFIPSGDTKTDSNPANPVKQNSPLDDFSKIWETPASDKSLPDKSFKYPKIDQAKFSEGINKLDFVSRIPEDLLGKAVAGDLQAFKQVLNTVGREAFSTGFQATDKYNNQLFNSYDESIGSRIPKEVKNIQSRAAVLQDMKSLDHPAVAPMLEVLTKQFQQMYPEASPQEISVNAKKYMMAVAQQITSQNESDITNGSQTNQRTAKSQSSTVTDFSGFEG